MYEFFFKVKPFNEVEVKNYTKLKENGTLNLFIPDTSILSEETISLIKNMLSYNPDERMILI